MTKIVRKRHRHGGRVAFWLGEDGQVWGWLEDEHFGCAEEQIAGYGGWRASEWTATMCGTTLAALRDELTEEGKDG